MAEMLRRSLDDGGQAADPVVLSECERAKHAHERCTNDNPVGQHGFQSCCRALAGFLFACFEDRSMLPPHLRAENLAAGADCLPESGGSGLATYMNEIVDGGITWDDLDWLCTNTPLPVWLKGVMHPDDARRAIDHGASGLVASNHGGRQLDRAPATIRALPAIARAVDGQVPLWLDGGIRRGADIFAALALGADGVAAVLDILRRELANTMSLCGCASLAAINRDCLFDTRAIES